MIKVGIIGGGGYTAGELIRILLYHPEVTIQYIHSNSQQGNLVSSIHSDLVGECWLSFTSQISFDVDVIFLCQGHGRTKTFMAQHKVPESVTIIDLSRDYRLDPAFVYGLPELNKPEIKNSKRIANCGCFATAIQLGLLPLAYAREIESDVHVHALTGSTGAGVHPAPTTHFSWRNNNVSVYKPFSHQHLNEIKRSLLQLQPGLEAAINFLPIRGNFSRGIFASLYMDTALSLDEIRNLYHSYYSDEPFVVISETNPSLKQVVNTNKCILYLEKHEGKILIISLIDNLVKGASGQAVQNMNLTQGLDETSGLRLKAAAF